MGRENLNRSKIQIHVRIPKDSYNIYRNDAQILRYILTLGETFVLNVIEYFTISLKVGSQY